MGIVWEVIIWRAFILGGKCPGGYCPRGNYLGEVIVWRLIVEKKGLSWNQMEKIFKEKKGFLRKYLIHESLSSLSYRPFTYKGHLLNSLGSAFPFNSRSVGKDGLFQMCWVKSRKYNKNGTKYDIFYPSRWKILKHAIPY